MRSLRWIRAGSACLLLLVSGCQSTGNWQLPGMNLTRKAELKHPEEMHLAYGRYSEQNGDVAKARESYEAVLEENQKSVEAILGLARLDLLGGRPEQAERRFREAMSAAPSSAEAIEATGQFYLSQERYDEAVQVLTRGVELAPANRRMRQRLAIALARQGNLTAAETHFVEAVGDAEADYNIGLILYERGDSVQAEQRLLSAVMKKPSLAQAQHWLDVVRQEQQARGIVGNNLTMRMQAPDSGAVPGGLPQYAPSRPGAPAALGNGPGTQAAAPQSPASTPSPITTTSGQTVPGQPASMTSAAGTVPATLTRPQTPLNPATMNATQLEQLENSMTPAEREAFRNSLRAGR